MDQQPEDKSLIDKHIVLRAYLSQTAEEEKGSAEELRHGSMPFLAVPPPSGQSSLHGQGARPKLLPSSPPSASVVSVPTPPQPSGIGSVDIDPRLKGYWSSPNLGRGVQFVPNYRTPGRNYVIKLPSIHDSTIMHEAPVNDAKLDKVYEFLYCSEEATNPRGEVLDQFIQIPIRSPGEGHNPEKISRCQLALVYRIIYGRDNTQTAQAPPTQPSSQPEGHQKAPETMAELQKRVFTPSGKIKRTPRGITNALLE